MAKIILCRLWQSAGVNPENAFFWNDNDRPFKLKEINKALENKLSSNVKPFGDQLAFKKFDRTKHLRRILFFIRNEREIKDIQIDNETSGYNILPIPVIVDGWHRLCAANFLRLKKVSITYGGRLDVLNYLTGKRKTLPL